MKIQNLSSVKFVSFIVLINAGIDQLSKYLIRYFISKNESISLLNDIIQLKNVDNSGAALGIGSDLPSMLKTMYFQLLPIIFLSYLFWLLIKTKEFSKLLVTGIAFAIGGGLGNIFDRIVDGYVTDFIVLNIGFFKNGVFNLADVSIMVGIILVFTDIFMNRKTQEHSD